MTALKDASVHDASTAVRSGAKVIGSIVYLFSINWKLATMITALVPVLSISAKLYGRHAKGKVKQVRQAMSDAAAVRRHRSHACCILARLVFASLNGGGAAAAAHAPACVQLCEESLSNIRTVRSFTQEAQREAVFVRALARATDLWRDAAYAGSIFHAGVRVCARACPVRHGVGPRLSRCRGRLGQSLAHVFILVCLVYFGGTLVLDGEMTPGALSSFLLHTVSMAEALSSIASVYTTLVKTMGVTERVFELLERETSIPLTGGAVLPSLSVSVCVRVCGV